MEKTNDGASLSFGDASALVAALARIIGEAPTGQQVLAFAAVVGELGDEVPGCKRMKGHFAAVQDCPEEQVVQDLAVDWTLAFRGVNPGTGPCPPYAGAWLAADAVGVDVMMAINSRYVEKGLGVGGGKLNRMDYLGVELEFVAYLLEQCAAVVASEQRCAMAAEAATFVDEYILSWLPRYRADVEAKCKTEFWKGYLELLEVALQDVSAECAQLGR